MAEEDKDKLLKDNQTRKVDPEVAIQKTYEERAGKTEKKSIYGRRMDEDIRAQIRGYK